MNIKDIKQNIIGVCRYLEEKEFVVGTWGNVSVRLGERIILTPSRIGYDVMTADDLVTVDLEGNIIEGKHTPTSEKEVHRLIYRSREDVGAIIHCHSLYATAAACSGSERIPPLMEEMSQLLGGEIPVTKSYIPAEQHHALGLEAAAAIADKNAVLLKNHGPVCCGRDLSEALLVCKTAEKACSIFLSLSRDTAPVEIGDKFVQSERYRYLYKYGKEKT